MKPRQTVTKSHALLERIAKRDVISEEQLLSDQALLELFSWHTKRAPRARIKDTLAVLVRQGTISQGTIDGQRLYKITSKGRTGLNVVAVRAQNPVTTTTWNGRWFFVTYQIPETHKSARNQLLIELKRIGFLRYGPALWVYPYDISSSVKKIAHHLGVEKYVDVLRADSIGQLASWKRRFKL